MIEKPGAFQIYIHIPLPMSIQISSAKCEGLGHLLSGGGNDPLLVFLSCILVDERKIYQVNTNVKLSSKSGINTCSVFSRKSPKKT